MRKWLWAIGCVWAAQVVTLVYFFMDLTWENYWFCRWLYRPGLRLFRWVGEETLPGHFFSPFDRRGVLAGFAFASLSYAIIAVGLFALIRRIYRSR